MAKHVTQSRPYAKAAFSVACESQTIEAWVKALAVCDQLLSVKAVRDFLLHPNVSGSAKAMFFVDTLGEASFEAFANFLHILAQNNRLLLLPSITALFESYLATLENRLSVNVRTAKSLSEDMLDRLADALKKKFGAQIQFEIEEDESLLAGAVLRVNDFVIDGSLRGRLAQFSQLN